MKFGRVHDIKKILALQIQCFALLYFGAKIDMKNLILKIPYLWNHFIFLKKSRFGMGITRSITWKFLLFCFKKKKFEEKQYEEVKLHKQCSLQPPPRLPFFWKFYLPLTIITTPLFMINLKRKNLTKFFNLDAIFGLLWVTFLIPFLR